MGREKVLELVGRVKTLPTLPAILSRLNEVIQDPDVSAQKLADVISSDPAITGSILRVVNSPFYGMPNRIATVAHAIVIMGFNTVKAVATSSSLVSTFGARPKVGNKYNREDFWMHSVACGAACRAISRSIGDAAMQEDYFTAGLLHDIGKIVEDEFFHDEFVIALDNAKTQGRLLRDTEEEVFGCDHADIGGHLFNEWKLSPGIVASVRYHHRPEEAGDFARSASVVHLGDICTRALMFGNGGDNCIPEILPFAMGKLGLDAHQIPSLLNAIETEVSNAGVFMDILRTIK